MPKWLEKPLQTALLLFSGVNGSKLPLVPAVVNCRRLLERLLTAARGY